MATEAQPSSSPIKTIVVLVQENRSFDHMLGWMKSLNPDIDGVTGNESNPYSTSDPSSARITFQDNSVYVDPDPGHSFQAIYEQVFGEPWSEASESKNLAPAMQGFVQNAEGIQQGMGEVVMNGFKPERLPVFKELVAEFAVCDRWFASLPSSTQSNRLFFHSATSHGATSNETQKLIEGYPQKTIFESLDEEGYDFGVYYQSIPTTMFYRNLRNVKYVTKFHPFDLSFKRHCKEGKLPNYVVIEPRYFDLLSIAANDDHPKHDISEGQKFVKEVYEALRASPQWKEILFVVVYDEHGGFYDHVPTPVNGVPSPDDIVGPEPFKFKFDRLGARVPALLISPWIERGAVLHEPSGPFPASQFEHSSIPATVKKIFNMKEFLTKRDEWAGTFDEILTRESPRTDCPVTLPEPVKLRETEAKEESKLSDFQEDLVQMASALKGEFKNIDPHKLVEDMKVADAFNYVENAFNKFRDDLEAKDDSKVDHFDNESSRTPSKNNNIVKKIFSCFVCDG